MLAVKITKNLIIPNQYPHITSEAYPPQKGRQVIVMLGWTMESIISKLLLAVPVNSIQRDATNLYIKPGTYVLKKDEIFKNGSLFWLYHYVEDTSNYLFGVDGVAIVCRKLLSHISGHSKDGKIQNDWTLLIAKEGDKILIDKFGSPRLLFEVKNGELKPIDWQYTCQGSMAILTKNKRRQKK